MSNKAGRARSNDESAPGFTRTLRAAYLITRTLWKILSWETASDMSFSQAISKDVFLDSIVAYSKSLFQNTMYLIAFYYFS